MSELKYSLVENESSPGELNLAFSTEQSYLIAADTDIWAGKEERECTNKDIVTNGIELLTPMFLSEYTWAMIFLTCVCIFMSL